MSRKLRFVPEGGSLVEVTCRTIQGRFLLRPSHQLREIVVGILARAQRLYPVEVCGLVVLSSHLHLLLVVPDAGRLALFMGYVNSNLAREAGRLAHWRDKFWARRYQAIVVSEEEAAQVGRLKYVLAHGVKEGLVAHPRDWPGVHGVHALLDGVPLEGYWFDRTREYSARNRGEEYSRLQFATPESLSLVPLPCWRHLSTDEFRRRIAALIAEIVEEGAARRQGAEPLGVEAILRQDPHSSAARPKKSPAPGFHAATRAVRRELYQAYAWFTTAFREASEKFRAGDRSARFPLGSFPPALPFVEAGYPP
jgi:REP element-mobilizing transposase RayT